MTDEGGFDALAVVFDVVDADEVAAGAAADEVAGLVGTSTFEGGVEGRSSIERATDVEIALTEGLLATVAINAGTTEQYHRNKELAQQQQQQQARIKANRAISNPYDENLPMQIDNQASDQQQQQQQHQQQDESVQSNTDAINKYAELPLTSLLRPYSMPVDVDARVIALSLCAQSVTILDSERFILPEPASTVDTLLKPDQVRAMTDVDKLGRASLLPGEPVSSAALGAVRLSMRYNMESWLTTMLLSERTRQMSRSQPNSFPMSHHPLLQQLPFQTQIAIETEKQAAIDSLVNNDAPIHLMTQQAIQELKDAIKAIQSDIKTINQMTSANPSSQVQHESQASTASQSSSSRLHSATEATRNRQIKVSAQQAFESCSRAQIVLDQLTFIDQLRPTKRQKT
jgi:hypothetical protein